MNTMAFKTRDKAYFNQMVGSFRASSLYKKSSKRNIEDFEAMVEKVNKKMG